MAFLKFGDYKQLKPIVFSTYQHLKDKAPRSAFKGNLKLTRRNLDHLTPFHLCSAAQETVNHRLVQAELEMYTLNSNYRSHRKQARERGQGSKTLMRRR